MESTEALDASYAHCRQIARRAGSNFYATVFLLPRQKRRAMWALSAFLQHCDDLSDNGVAEADGNRCNALAAWRSSTERAFAGEFNHPLLPALKDTVDRFQIPHECLTATIDGMEKVLTKEVGVRTREIIRQACNKNGIQIIKGRVSKDHVHLYISYPPKLSVSDMVQIFQGRSSRKIQDEFPQLGKVYWGKYFWAIGYAAFSSGHVTDDNHPNHNDDEFRIE